MDDIDASWARLLERQHGVVSRAQAIAHGFTDAHILAQIAARRWVRHRRGVLVTFTGPLTRGARLWAVLLALGDGAALSHESAAREWGMLPPRSDEEPDSVLEHVTVREGRSALGHPGVRVHRSRAFTHIVTERDGRPVTTPAHTVLDLALAAPSGAAAVGVVLRTATAGKVQAAALREAHERRGLRRHRRAVLEAIRLLESGVTSVLETHWVLDVERAHGLPDAERQVPVEVDGRTLFEDCIYRCPGGEAIVRLDGSTHAARSVRLRDRRRGNAAELTGRARLVFGWEETVGQPCAAARELETVLRELGWSGEFQRCPRCP